MKIPSLHSLPLLLLAGVGGGGSLVHGLTAGRPAPRSITAANKEHFGANPNNNKLFAAPPIGNKMDRSAWRVTCDSEQPGNECRNAIDGDANTFWHSKYSAPAAPLPHTITLDMGALYNINGISAQPRQDGSQNGWIARHQVQVSPDGDNWQTVALGYWPVDALSKFSNFEVCRVRYIRIICITEVNGNPWASIAEIHIYEPAGTLGPTAYAGNGIWGSTIDFPTVPVAGLVDVITNTITIWSAYAYNNYLGSSWDRVYTAKYDPATGLVTPKIVDNTDHDMFCPGISIDGLGNVVVTGGNSKSKTTKYDYASEQWSPQADMRIPRGYQSSATCSDGRVFTIGGSWSGGEVEPKDGEIFDPRANTWTLLPSAKVAPMLTQDAQGVYRSDNHAWLFGWKNGSVFQAGPSIAMNWYTTGGPGGVSPAGNRGGNAQDSMCGISVMYDAVAGKILTAGGSPSYQQSAAHADAHIITLGDRGANPDVRPAGGGSMAYARAFANGVVLPGGRVFITGGQSYAVPFTDDTAQLTPELYDPATDRFIPQATNTIPRNYHSIALLMPDARVFSAGGGLCGDCQTNHFNGQIFTPAYLLDQAGRPVTNRPVITAASIEQGGPGGRRIRCTTNAPVDLHADLIRVGTATHTVNTDQRRVALTLTRTSGNTYTANLPGDPGILTPGYWMFFVMNANGVPSVAKMMDLTLK